MLDLEERDAQIVEILEKDPDRSYRSVGEEFGITGARVHQIRKEAGLPDRGYRSGEDHPNFEGEEMGDSSPYVPEKKYTDKQLLMLMRWLALTLGHSPRNQDIRERTPVSHTTYYMRFGSLREAQETAGLAPNRQGKAAPITPGFKDRWTEELLQYVSAKGVLHAYTEED